MPNTEDDIPQPKTLQTFVAYCDGVLRWLDADDVQNGDWRPYAGPGPNPSPAPKVRGWVGGLVKGAIGLQNIPLDGLPVTRDQAKTLNDVETARLYVKLLRQWAFSLIPVPEPEKKAEAPAALSKRAEAAYQSYQMACDAIAPGESDSEPEDRVAYVWLQENGPTTYELPAFETWQKYVRDARLHYGSQKNSPRSGRSGRSIVSDQDV